MQVMNASPHKSRLSPEQPCRPNCFAEPASRDCGNGAARCAHSAGEKFRTRQRQIPPPKNNISPGGIPKPQNPSGPQERGSEPLRTPIQLLAEPLRNPSELSTAAQFSTHYPRNRNPTLPTAWNSGQNPQANLRGAPDSGAFGRHRSLLLGRKSRGQLKESHARSFEKLCLNLGMQRGLPPPKLNSFDGSIHARGSTKFLKPTAAFVDLVWQYGVVSKLGSPPRG